MDSITNSSLINSGEEKIENDLRPKNFNEIIGREKEKKSLMIMIEAAKKKKKAIDHILFYGPPGLGKTSISYVIGQEMGVPMHVTSGSVIDKPGDLAAILTALEPHSILFIDEIHRLRRTLEEILYPAMEDYALDIIIGKGPSAKTLRIDLPPFTVIGATTKLSMLSGPLRDRFGMNFRLDFYSDEELEEMVRQKAGRLRVNIDREASFEIARRSRMTARIAIRILKRVADLATVNNVDIVGINLVHEVLEMLGVDDHGLTDMDRALIKILYKNYNNRPVGLNTLAVSLSEESDTVESVYEPFLIKKGFLKRTPRGRQLTDLAINEYNNLLI